MEIGALSAGTVSLQSPDTQLAQQIDRQNDTQQQAAELQAGRAEESQATSSAGSGRVGSIVDTFA